MLLVETNRVISTRFSEEVVSKKLLDRIISLIEEVDRVCQMSFDLGDLMSHRKPMRCVI